MLLSELSTTCSEKLEIISNIFDKKINSIFKTVPTVYLHKLVVSGNEVNDYSFVSV